MEEVTSGLNEPGDGFTWIGQPDSVLVNGMGRPVT